MERFDWTLTIKTNILILKMVGLWPEGSTGYKINLYLIRSVLLTATFVFGHVSFQTINLIFIFKDFEAVTEIIYLLLTEIILVFKVYYVVTNMKLLKKLMLILGDHLFQPKSQEQIRLVEPSLNFWRLVYRALLALTCGANLFWAIFPLLDTTTDRRLPFLAWYPYDWKISPFYEITYFYQVFSIWYISAAHLNVDTLIAALNVYSGNQLDLLCDNLRNLKQISVEEELMCCISHHKLILTFTKDCNKFFNWIIALQFFVSGISLGLTLFQLTLVIPFSNQFYSVISFANVIIVQIFMYCWFGNEVQVKSENVPNAAFKSDWTDMPKEVKKNLYFFIMTTQKPITISALNLFTLSLETFMKILKTGWSYFALLHQVNSRE